MTIRSFFILLPGLVSACGGSLQTVPMAAHGSLSEQAVPVDAPPPPAKVEQITKSPGGDCAWLDGQWLWQGQHWEWEAGTWVIAPRDCYYAEPVISWIQATAGATLFFARGTWYPNISGQSCPAPRSCVEASPRTL